MQGWDFKIKNECCYVVLEVFVNVIYNIIVIEMCILNYLITCVV